jgi:flagellar biosynthesis protein FlhA
MDQANKARAKAAPLDGAAVDAVTMAAATEEPIADVLKMDDLKIEIGYASVPLVNSADGTDRVTEQINAATVLSTHLTEVIKSHMAELLSHIEVQNF